VSTLWSPRRGGLLALAAVIAVLPLFMQNAFHYDIAILVGLNAIVCVGLNLLIGYAGQISLGHAGFFALGAYGSAILSGDHDWPPLAALLCAAAGVGLLSFIIARPILRLKGHYLAMGTLGMGIIISIVLNQEVDLTGGPDGMPVPSFSLFGWEPAGELTWYALVGGLLLATRPQLDRFAGRPGAARRARLGDGGRGDGHRHRALQGTGLRRLRRAGQPGRQPLRPLQRFHLAGRGGILPLDRAGHHGRARRHGLDLRRRRGRRHPDRGAAAAGRVGAVLMGMMIFLRKGLVPSLAQLLRERRK
jgi:hypothetical protein